MIDRRFPPKVVEVLVTFFLPNAMNDAGRIIRNFQYFLELYEVDSDDKDSIKWISRLIVRGKDPIIVAIEAVLAANDEVIRSSYIVIISDHNVVVLNQASAHTLQQIWHLHNFLVNRIKHESLGKEIACDTWGIGIVSWKTKYTFEWEYLSEAK